MSSPLECSEGKFFCLLCSQLYSQGLTHNRSSNIGWLNEGAVRDLFFSWNKKYGGAGPLGWFKRLVMPSGNQALPVFSLCPSSACRDVSSHGLRWLRLLQTPHPFPTTCKKRSSPNASRADHQQQRLFGSGDSLHLLHPQSQRSRGGAVTVMREGQINSGETASQSTAPFPSLLPLPIAALSEEASPLSIPYFPQDPRKGEVNYFS